MENKRLLIISHTPSPNLQRMLAAIVTGASCKEVSGIEVVSITALKTVAEDVLKADAVILLTPENL